MRFSHYGLKRLEIEARKRRVAAMVRRSGNDSVTLDEVTRVLAGDLLPPRRQAVQALTRRAAVLCEAARQFGRPGDRTTPETIVTYRTFMSESSTLWSRFVGRSRERMLEAHRGSVAVPTPVAWLYEWINEDELVAEDALLRTATLYWGLTLLYPYTTDMMAIDALVDHELRAGGVDRQGIFVIPDFEAGRDALHLSIWTRAADHEGDLTDFFEHFVSGLARSLSEHHRRLEGFQDAEDRLPWLMVRPPDELDRQIFDNVERLGSVRAQDILRELSDPPPLRTLQRRLQRLARDGLITKHGSRKFAFYRLTERS
jgi:hypothetical protein